MKPMSPLDAAMVAVEPFTPPQHVAGILIMTPPAEAGPDYVDEIYRQALSDPGPVDPRLRRHAHRGIDTGGVYVWRDGEPDIAEHVHRRTLAPGSGPEGLWTLISEVYSERLDPTRPLWSMYIIDGLDDGRFVFVVKVHHALMDGVAGFQFISNALSPDPARRSMPHIFGDRREQGPKKARSPKPSGGWHLPNPFTALRSLVDTVTSSAELVEHVATNLLQSGKSDTRIGSIDAPHTRFNAQAGEQRGLAAGSWPKKRIAAVRNKADVSSNDVIVAAIGGAVRKWLSDNDELPDRSLVALCPITVRGRDNDEDSEGNMFGLWLCPLGTDLAEPSDRLDLIHRSMAEGKDTVRTQGSAASMLTLVPTQIATVLSPRLPIPKIRTGSNIPITNVPGPATDLYWNGAHVDEIFPVAMIFDGIAFTVTVCSYDDKISLTYLAGREVVPDLDRFIALTETSLTELEKAVGITKAARKAKR